MGVWPRMGVPGERMTVESYATLSWNLRPKSLKRKGGSTGGVLVQERGFFVLTGMPRSVLGESCTYCSCLLR